MDPGLVGRTEFPRRRQRRRPEHQVESDPDFHLLTVANIVKEPHDWMDLSDTKNGDQQYQYSYNSQTFHSYGDRSIGEQERWKRTKRTPRTYPSTRTKYCVIPGMILFLVGSHAFNSPANCLHARIESIPAALKIGAISMRQPPRFKLYSTFAKESDSYDFDSMEEDFVREQTSQPNNKSIRSRRKKSQKGKRNIGSTLPTEPTARRKKTRPSSKTYKLDNSVQMPPWLAQYENEDFTGSYYLAEESQLASDPSVDISWDEFGTEDKKEDIHQMQRLLLALNGIFNHPLTHYSHTTNGPGVIAAESVPEAIPHFSTAEIHEILDSIRVASHGNRNLIAGCADFLYLMLTLEEEGVLTSEFLSSEPWDDDGIGADEEEGWDTGANQQGRPEPHSIMTRDVLVAAAFHYCDCVRARKAGVYDYARQAMEASLDMRIWKELEKKQLWLPQAVEDSVETSTINGKQDVLDVGDREGESAAVVEGSEDSEGKESIVVHRVENVSKRGEPPIQRYGVESGKIAAGAARLKRAEIMATTMNSNGRKISRGNTSQPNGDAEILRSFLVSLSEDWRALVIRSAACLYRLKGISDSEKYAPNVDGYKRKSKPIMLSTTTINTAREAIRIYAPLAQRLGMQRLKTELENTAFRILYPRQFSVASSLYSRDIDEMKSIVQVLSSRIEQLLRSDQVFIDQIEDVKVTSRVKEPYSLWKKILRYRKEAAVAKNKSPADTGRGRKFLPSTLSLKWVPDSIAFRVVLRALKLSPLEDDESLRTREKMLCYYCLQLISDIWPASALNEAKDYIKNPKPNGYQSLHYTASLRISGEEWPFEVQIRSEEMHRIAEFGVAAHWDYKLQNKVIQSLPDQPLPDQPTSIGTNPLPALPSEIKPLITTEANTTELSILGDSSRVAQKGRVASYIDALTTSRDTIVQTNLFVIISSTKSALDGKIVSIDPSTPNVADVLEKYGAALDEHILHEISAGTLEIYQNGIRTSLDRELSNGDVLTLPSIIIDKLSV